MAAARRLVAALALFLVGWAAVLWQHELLWQRVPPSGAARFVADSIAAALPPVDAVAVLQQACAQAPPRIAPWRSGWVRDKLAACLASPDTLVAGADAEAAVAALGARVQAQVEAAARWLQDHDAHAGAQRSRLATHLWKLQAGAAVVASPPRELPDSSADADAAATVLRERAQSTQRRLREIVAGKAPAPEQARDLALLAAGQRLVADYGVAPPRMALAPARGSLADALEWQRRGRGYVERGFVLDDLRALPVALLVAAALACGAAAFASRARLGVMAPAVLATQLLGCGALLLCDLALTGDPALRFLADRQYLRLPVGDGAVPLVWRVGLPGGVELPVWGPLALVAVATALVGLLRDGQSAVLAPLRAWVRAAGDPASAAWQGVLLALAGLGGALLLGLPAAASELLLFLACLGAATFVAAQAPRANAAAGIDRRSLAGVGAALALAVGGSVARGDLGHALVAVCLALCFAWLAGWRWLQALVLLAVAAAAVAVGLTLAAGTLAGPMAWAAPWLPEHAQQRLEAMPDPFGAASSDLARSRWIMRSAGAWGWGPGYVPWQGLDPARVRDGLPLQGPSDYVTVLVVATWGRVGGTVVLAVLLATFVLLAATGLRTALRAGTPPAIRLLAALGGFGCVAVAAKAGLSIGGVTGVLPLTGLPVALLGYGPASLAAALGYAVLAWGTAHAGAGEAARGVVVRPSREGGGRMRAGARWLGAGGALATVVLLGLGFQRLAGDAGGGAGPVHVAQRPWHVASALSRAMVPADAAATVAPCPELRNAVAAWDERLATARPPLRLDPGVLIAAQPVADGGACARLARRVGALLDADPGRVLAARARDFTTPDPWWGRPGCVAAAAGSPADCRGRTTATALAAIAGDAWLRRDLLPHVRAAVRTPSGTAEVQGHAIAVGARVALTLDERLQATAQRMADCWTGRGPRPGCTQWLPADGLRAGALGLVLAEVDTGRLVALAGAISPCTLAGLGRQARTDARGRVPALVDDAPCAQLPDRRSAWLAGQHPALWMVPPGSSVKPVSVAAGIDAGVVPAGEDARWKAILAESRERLPVQRVALAAGPRYLQALAGAGWGLPRQDLLWGAEGAAQSWTAALYDGSSGLRATGMTLDEAERLRAQKLAGANLRKLHGPRVEDRFVAARRLADAAVGGGDLRVNAVGLVDVWRALDLRARGRAAGPALHVLERDGVSPAQRDLQWLSRAAATRLLAMTSGVTASAWKGTAQGSCRVVFGACPAQGLPGVSGKTGTADFLAEEEGRFAKPGLQLPAKLFGGVFTGADGKRYAVAAMALRVRSPGSQTLELGPSAAAEAALVLMRELGVHPAS